MNLLYRFAIHERKLLNHQLWGLGRARQAMRILLKDWGCVCPVESVDDRSDVTKVAAHQILSHSM